MKVPPGKGCGFVQYTTREAAEVAINQMNGAVVGGVKIRCAWGRSAAVRAAAAAAVTTGGYYPQYPGYQQSGYQVGVSVSLASCASVDKADVHYRNGVCVLL